MPPTLFGVLEKRDWAHHHFNLIETSINGYINSNPCPIITDGDPEKGIYTARLHYPQAFDVRTIGLMIGDCVHSMRCALDYLVWELAGFDLNDQDTMFPICESAEDFQRIRKKRIGRLSSEAQTAIERLQPYNARYGGHEVALGAINRLDNADKHKVLTVTIAVTGSCIAHPRVFPSVDIKGVKSRQRFFPAKIQHNAVVAAYIISPPVPEVDVEFKITPQILFSKMYQFEKPFVLPYLQWMLNSVDVVIKRMDKFFPSTEKE
jgi:hypothetical protein